MKKVGIIMGSDSDLPILRKAMDTLESLGIPYECHIYSAHRTPEEARQFALNARANGFGAIIAAAGMAAHRREHHPSRYRHSLQIHLSRRH